eukprot:PhM_4_TR1285/c2_g6_i1/m.7119
MRSSSPPGRLHWSLATCTTHLVDSVRGLVDNFRDALRLQEYVVPQLDGFESKVKNSSRNSCVRSACLMPFITACARRSKCSFRCKETLNTDASTTCSRRILYSGRSAKVVRAVVVADVVLTRQKVKRLQIANMAIRNDGNDDVHGLRMSANIA